MIERDLSEYEERQYANEMLAWLQGADGEQPAILTTDAKARFRLLGVPAEGIGAFRDIILLADDAHQIPLWLYFSGFTKDVLTRLLGEDSSEIIRSALENISREHPGVFRASERGAKRCDRPEEKAQIDMPPRNNVRRGMGLVATKWTPSSSEPQATENIDDADIEGKPEVNDQSTDNSIVRLTRRSEDDEGYADVVLGPKALITDMVRVYMIEAGKVPLLNAEGEVRLSKQIEAGLYAQQILEGSEETEISISKEELLRIVTEGESAKNQMIEANLRLVIKWAAKYQGRGLDFLDLIQEGNLGLLRAVEKFDYKKGYKFSTYATWWIKQALTRGLANSSDVVRLPVYKRDEVNTVRRINRELRLQLGREPTVTEVAIETGLSEARVVEDFLLLRPTISLHEVIGEDGDTERIELIADRTTANDYDDALHALAVKDIVGKLIGALNPRTAGMVALRNGFYGGKEHTLDEIGKKYGVTKECVRQIINKGMANIIQQANNQGFSRDVKEILKYDV